MKGKTYNMFALILHPRFKSFCLISSYIACEQDKPIVEEYGKQFVYPMFFKYHHLHLLVKFESDIID
jgi:ABC-type microcin C transport system permease subunit YejE